MDDGLVRRVEQRCCEHLAAMGLTARRRQDFDALRAFLLDKTAQPPNPTFDPAQRTPEPGAWWLEIATAAGEVVATIAATVIEGDLVELIESGRLWYDPARLPADWPRLGRVFPLQRAVAGRLQHDGAGWVHPDYRRGRLAFVMQTLVRAATVRDASIDWVTGVCFPPVVQARVPERCYGYPDAGIELVLRGYFPGTGRDERLYALSMDRGFAEASFLSRLLLDPARCREAAGRVATG